MLTLNKLYFSNHNINNKYENIINEIFSYYKI